MICPKCGEKTHVTDSRGGIHGTILRVRRCPRCGYRFKSVEKFLEECEKPKKEG